MTTNVTSPGAVCGGRGSPPVVSFVVITIALSSIAIVQRRRAAGARRATLTSTE